MHVPQLSAPPQPSPAGPHEIPWAAHVVGVQVPVPQTPGLPPPPQVWPVGHDPQSSVLPQPSPAVPHEKPCFAQVSGVHVNDPQTLGTPPPPHVSGGGTSRSRRG